MEDIEAAGAAMEVTIAVAAAATEDPLGAIEADFEGEQVPPLAAVLRLEGAVLENQEG